MADPTDINRRSWDERAAIHSRDTTGFYSLDRFRAGENALNGIEAAELGDVRGKHVLHLQCHIGLDTLRLVRLGAIATGLDFSGEAVTSARRLAEETGLNADFVQGTVDDAPSLTPGPFDLVFTTWGVLCWLPDMRHQSTREWIHPLSAILGALIDAGLMITMFREHEILPWQSVSILVPTPDGQWRLPDGHPRIPLSFSVRAKKAV
jgi:2-polyprenyl-3-methyl-5-hydroxy-6-metoxy-1,4-benzoquinol methylase